MKNKLITDLTSERIFVLVYEPGEAFQKTLLFFAQENNIGVSQFTAIGAFRSAMLGYFDRQLRDYIKFSVSEQVEVLTLNGNITFTEDFQPKIHAHAIVGMRDGSVKGGHLFEAEVWPTLEVVITETPRHLMRKFNPEAGLALIEIHC